MTEQGSRSWKARSRLEKVATCGCYYCLRTYSPKEIREWVDGQETALCPKCGIDSVVPYESSDGTDAEFALKLKQWNKESFS
jgi:hypothetical protein